MKDLIIVGAGGFGREVLQWLTDINQQKETWKIKGFIDDNIHALKNYPYPEKVLGTIEGWKPSENEVFVCAISDPDIKERVVKLLKSRGAEFASVIHPDASIGTYNELGEGVVIYPDARITVNVKIGDFVTFLHSFAGHDVTIGDYSTIFGCSSLNGFVHVGNNVLISSHVDVIPGRKIGDHAFVGAGSVVVDNVKSNTKVFGNPAKKMIL